MELVENWKKVVLQNYANFEGRARRREFWLYVAANAIISIVLNVLGQVSSLFSIVALLYGLAVIVPGIAVGVRRLHDIGKPGILLLVGLIPCVGFILLIVWAAQDSQRGSNQYGPSEKYPNG